jgi:tight adherence protein C
MSDAAPLLVLAAAAVSAVLAWLAGRRLVLSVPAEDRRWRDAPPLAWRLAWPALRVLGGLVAPFVPVPVRVSLSRSLRQAGLDLALDPPHLVAAVLLAGACAAGIAALVWPIVLEGLSTQRIPRALAGSRGQGASAWPAAACMAAIGAAWPLAWVRERRAARLQAIGRALPFFLDVITLAVESGANLTGAIGHAVGKGPPGPLRAELERVLRDVRAGRTRADALRCMGERLELPAVTSWVAALVSAERHGSGLGPILRAQAEQRREERFQRAEKLAMRAPVKMLFPLLVFIFPCTFVLLAFPVVVRLVEEGLLR